MPDNVRELIGELRRRAIEYGDGGTTQALLYRAAEALEALTARAAEGSADA
jgi:hypothetical protein